MGHTAGYQEALRRLAITLAAEPGNNAIDSPGPQAPAGGMTPLLVRQG